MRRSSKGKTSGDQPDDEGSTPLPPHQPLFKTTDEFGNTIKGGGLIQSAVNTQEELDRLLSQSRINLESFTKPQLLRVSKDDPIFATLFLSHYPGSWGVVGRSLSYLVIYKGKVAGIIGAKSPPWNVSKIDTFFHVRKTSYYLRGQDYKRFMDNNVYRLIVNEPNLATRVLRAFRSVIRIDSIRKYGNDLDGLCTFVENPHSGICYKADNWTYLGMTKGYSVHQRGSGHVGRKVVKDKPRHIFCLRF